MLTIHLGFKAFDPHELACHFVARHAGLYRAHGLQVRLLDTNFVAEEQLPPRTFQAACTAALLASLQGAPVKVVFVACERPMFWLVSRRESGGSQDLAGGRIAGYPPHSPPAGLLQLALPALGLGAGREPVVLPVRDDFARIGLLVSGDVEAAVVSSAVPLGRMSGRGLIPLLFFGDVLRLPTTGLAVSRDLYAQEPELVRAMCECCRESLRLLRTDAALARKAVAAAFGLNSSEADETLALLRRCYTTDGRCDAQVQNFAIESVRRVLGSAAQPVGEPYDFSLLAHSRGVSADHE